MVYSYLFLPYLLLSYKLMLISVEKNTMNLAQKSIR